MRMKERKSVKRRLRVPAALAAGLLLATTVAESAAFGAARGRAKRKAAAPEALSPLEIQAVELHDEVAGTRLEVATSGPMIWTSYRDLDGSLIIELPNSLPSAQLADLDYSLGVVESAQFEVHDSGERPLTRLVVRTRDEAEHSVSTEGHRLQVNLVPVDVSPGAITPASVPVDGGVPAESAPEETVVAVAEEILSEPLAAEPLPEATDLALLAETEPETSFEDAADRPRMGPAPDGVPATQLLGVEVDSGGEATTVWIQGDGSFYYSTFSLADPYRFVVDLPGVINTAQVSTLTVAAPVVDGVRLAQFRPQPDLVSRVVVDLFQDATPAIEATGDGLKLVFGGDPVAVASDAEWVDAPAAADEWVETVEPAETDEWQESPPQTAQAAPETDVETAGEVAEIGAPVQDALDQALESEPVTDDPVPAATDWTDSPAEPVAAMEEPVMEEAAVPAPLRPEEIDLPPPAAVTQVAQVVPPVDPPAGAVDEPTDVSLFDVREIDLDEEPEGTAGFDAEPVYEPRDVTVSDQPEYYGEPITMTLKDADIKDVLRSFAQFSGLNVVVQPGVEGEVTVQLTDVPWDQALAMILKINGLDYQLEGNIMRIAPVEQFRAEAEERAAIEAAKVLAVPLKTVMQRVSYATASDIASVLAQGRGGILSQRGSVLVDNRTNTLIIKELPDNINTVLAVIESLDIPEPQVIIEARIIETTKRFSRTLGIQWGFQGIASPELGNTTGLQFPNNVDAQGQVNLITGGNFGLLDISLGNVLNSFTLDATLQAAENEGLINILSSPKIATLNNSQATIQSGLQIPIQTVANNTVSVQFVNATLRLEVTPHVTAEGTVLMDIDIQKKEPQIAFAVPGATNAPIATRDASTRVIVRDGGTAVIGGIYEVSSDQGEDRVPGLANVPLIGHLFKNKRRTDENEELLIFITPRIVRL